MEIKSTIDSKNFQKRQMLFHRQQSPGPDVLFLIRDQNCIYYGDDTKGILLSSSPSSLFSYYSVDDNFDDHHTKIISSSIKILGKKWFRLSNSCDGLICFCNDYESIIINPTTRWHKTFPPSNFLKQPHFGWGWFGFGKDKFNGTYKSVWLYNNTPFSKCDKKKTITRCEVFDFRNNAWRYVTCPASPYDIIVFVNPVHLEGSILWLVKCEELDIQVLSFDLHTETFQVIANAPFDRGEFCHYKMCNLNNNLCLSETKYPNQVLWLFDSGSKTWTHMCSIDLNITYSWFRKSTKYEEAIGNCIGSLTPLAVLEERNEKTKVLFYFDIYKERGTYFVIYDGQTDSFEFAFRFNSLENCFDDPICCFQSLISIL